MAKVGRLIEDDPLAVQRDSRKGNHYQQHKADNDYECRFELFLLDDGQKKVEQKDETRTSRSLSHYPTVPHLSNFTNTPRHIGVPNTAVFTFNKEDHTLANLLSQRLLKYPYVTFSAYKVPHPLFATFELRVSTDGSITPKDAVVKCCKDVIGDLDTLNRSFTTEWLGKRIVSEGDAERAARERGDY